MLRNWFIILFFIGSSGLFSQVPEGYYNSIHSKGNRELKTALHTILKRHTVLNYGDLWYYFRTTDVKDDGITVWDMYSGNIRYYSSKPRQSASGIQREHSLPKSWWATSGVGEKYAAYTDLNHLYPSDGEANQAKSNYMLGVVSHPGFDNGVSKVGGNTYSYSGSPKATAFEPADEYKGDFARAYFYMITCYEDYAQQWRSDALNMFNRETYPVLKPWARDMLLKWHRNDPVSNKEIVRNNEVYSYQNNRNPFIDYPQLVEYIWGDSTNYVFILPNLTNKPALITPANLSEIYFGEIQKNSEVAKTIIVKGVSLTGKLSVALRGTDKNYFKIHVTSIPAAVANAENGYLLQITYNPKKYGKHNATLIISNGGTSASTIVYLKGECGERK
jgi:endonuclease I